MEHWLGRAMISLDEAHWVRLEPDTMPTGAERDSMQAFCSMPGTYNTHERLLVTPGGQVYRERSWDRLAGVTGRAGSAWFKLIYLAGYQDR